MNDARSPFLVTTEWLASHLADPDVIVVDARLTPVGIKPKPDPRAQYLAGHIPGAVFFDIDTVSDAESDLPHMLPSADIFARLMGDLGIRHEAKIVVYDGDTLFSAPRVWWTFRVFGARNVYILDGGLKAWVDEGRPTEAGNVARPAAEFSACLNRAMVKEFSQVLDALKDGATQVIDARAAERFKGLAPEPRAGLRSGHMPGSINIPYTELIEAGRLKSQSGLRRIFAERQVDLSRPIVTSCGSGVTAAVLTFGLEAIGAASAIYDGSWSEWGNRPEAPVEVTPA